MKTWNVICFGFIWVGDSADSYKSWSVGCSLIFPLPVYLSCQLIDLNLFFVHHWIEIWMCVLQELEPKVGGELCKLWDADQSGPSGRALHANNTISTSRRGKPPGASQPETRPSPSQWRGVQQTLGYPAIQQVYTTHTPSMPIPVPVPSAHSRHTISAPYPHQQMVAQQPVPVHPQTSVPFATTSAVALQPHFHPHAPRFPGTMMQSSHMRNMGPTSHVTRGAFNPPRKWQFLKQ